ncbi:hypothetical protein YC2023_041879 [Brassica napus]
MGELKIRFAYIEEIQITQKTKKKAQSLKSKVQNKSKHNNNLKNREMSSISERNLIFSLIILGLLLFDDLDALFLGRRC